MKFWEISREKQVAILREDMSIKQRSALEFEYDLPKSHLNYDNPTQIPESVLESYISNKYKRWTLVSVLDCLTSHVLEKLYKISTKWGIEVSLGRGDYILFKNNTIHNDSKILYIDLESLTDIKFEEFHPYAQGTPVRIQILAMTAFFFYGAFLGNALRV
jgi:hypothetical protein